MSETSKALFKDALYQVLDNKVFRLLVILGMVLVLPTFLIAAKPEQLELFWGWRTYRYEDVLQWFELQMPADPAAAHATLIQEAQKLLVENLGGNFGLIFALAATAFFVPRMVEKGAADTVFSKPVSRGALLMSRYVAGLLFVALLATVLVVGMHVGLLLNSGYSDSGFLWSIPVIVYKYAILHAISLLVAVITRSSVAAILTTLMFFAFTSCVHLGWQAKGVAERQLELRMAAGDEPEQDDPSAVIDGLLVTLDVLHYTLPKTNDAAVISQSLRKSLAERRTTYRDSESGLSVGEDPEGMSKVEVGAEELPVVARWVDPRDAGSVTLKRWPLSERKRPQALRELDAQLADMGIEGVKKGKAWILGQDQFSREWTQPRGELQIERETILFPGKRHLFALEFELPRTADGPERDRGWEWRFKRSFELAGVVDNPHSLVQQEAKWTGPLPYNLWFSLGSTLAFVALTLAFAWWRLSRIDF